MRPVYSAFNGTKFVCHFSSEPIINVIIEIELFERSVLIQRETISKATF